MEKLRFFLIWLSAILLAGGWLLPARQALAFEPKTDYWFIESFTLGKVNLPDGVDILTSDPDISPRDYLVVENRTQTPLYVMSLNYKDVLVMVTPDPGWKTRVSLAHEAAAYLVMPERPAALTIEALVDLDHTRVDRNVVSYDPPPSDLALPPSQSSELLLVYGSQVIEAPFTISYTHNAGFDNGSAFIYAVMQNLQATDSASATATQAALTTAASARDSNLVLGLAAVAVILLGGWLVWKINLRRH